MTRRVATWLLAAFLLTIWPSQGAWAQANPKDTGIVVGEGNGSYTEASSVSLLGAFDRAVGELDAAGTDVTPRQAKDSSYRRRFLELRLLMDFHAFAYDRDQMKMYRDVVDRAYETMGVYQDITDIEKELGVSVGEDVVNQRKAEMNEGVGPMRDGGMRNNMRSFLASPLKGIRNGGGPGLWDLIGAKPGNGWDNVGNSAEFQAGILRYLQGADLGVADIFNPDQAYQFHLIRKQIRDVVILSAMYPPTSDATRDVVKPLSDLVGDYGDVLEAFVAYQFAQNAGMDTEKIAAELRREFEKSQAVKDQFIEAHALDAMAIRLNEVRDAHKR